MKILIGLLAIAGGTAVWFAFSAAAPQEPFAYDREYELGGEDAWLIRISKDGTGFRARLNGRLLLVRFPELKSWTLENESAQHERAPHDRDGLNLVFEGLRRKPGDQDADSAHDSSRRTGAGPICYS